METCLICEKDVVIEAGKSNLLCPECVGSSNYFQGGPAGKQKRVRKGVAKAPAGGVSKAKGGKRRRKSNVIDLSSDNQKLDITSSCHPIRELLVQSANSKVRCYLQKLSEAAESASSKTPKVQGRLQRKANVAVKTPIS